MPNIIYLIGYAGTGKYTIAKELEKSGYVICDNQLINNPINALLNYDYRNKETGRMNSIDRYIEKELPCTRDS